MKVYVVMAVDKDCEGRPDGAAKVRKVYTTREAAEKVVAEKYNNKGFNPMGWVVEAEMEE